MLFKGKGSFWPYFAKQVGSEIILISVLFAVLLAHGGVCDFVKNNQG